MPRLSHTPNSDIVPHVLDRAVARIAPFFSDGSAQFTEAQSRKAALHAVLSFGPSNGKELQLAAQMCAQEIAALDCLRCAAVIPGNQVETVLRIQEYALKLNAMSMKAQKALDAGRHAARAGTTAFDEAEFTQQMSRVQEMVTFARTRAEAARIAQELEAASAASTGEADTRRKAEKAWAEDLQNVAAWTQQTQH